VISTASKAFLAKGKWQFVGMGWARVERLAGGIQIAEDAES
jgi:hypothetical protein